VKGAYRAALACGALPLVTGASIFGLWVVTRREWLMVAGVFTLFVGLALFVVGALALARYAWLALRMAEPPVGFWVSAALAAGLLLSNFPAAGLIVWKVADLESTYTVVVRNESGAPLRGLHVAVGEHTYASFAPIPAGASATRTFRIRREGSLELHTAGGPRTIDPYVSAGFGATAFVTFAFDGGVSVAFAGRDD
jgi:hypothetical protein